MINFSQLGQVLSENSELPLQLILPSGDLVPLHFHITEVGSVHKHFIDCGGTARESHACVLQAWVAHDVEHRINAGKLHKILNLYPYKCGVRDIFDFDKLPMEIEYGENMIGQYIVDGVEISPSALIFKLIAKKTDCLAPDKCGIKKCDSDSCCC